MEVVFEDEPSVEQALFIWKDCSADFADCLIGAHNVGWVAAPRRR